MRVVAKIGTSSITAGTGQIDVAAIDKLTREIASLRADAHDRDHVRQFLNEAADCFPAGDARLFGPLPAIMERVGGRTRMYLVLQSAERSGLHAQLDAWLPGVRALPSARRVRWSIDVDPQEL